MQRPLKSPHIVSIAAGHGLAPGGLMDMARRHAFQQPTEVPLCGCTAFQGPYEDRG